MELASAKSERLSEMKPVVELVATGNELLNGRVLNRHAQWAGGELLKIGWTLAREVSVSDDRLAILESIRDAFTRVNVVLVSGGLGPTSDDLSRDAAAEWAGCGIVMHEPSRQRIRDVYASRSKPLNDLVESHALVVEQARVLENREGLAPGEHIQCENRHLFLLPGPPREFHAVMSDHVLPWLRQTGIGDTGRAHTFQIIGLGESDVAARLNQRGLGHLRLEVAYCANPSHLYIRLREQSGHASDYDQAVKIIRDELMADLFCENEDHPAQIIVDLLSSRDQTMAVAESCTGGMLGSLITAIPGSSAVFLGGILAYHNKVKSIMLNVPDDSLAKFGAVSESVVTAMADGVRIRLGADIGVAITGVAGPGGGTNDKPVGLVYICASDRNKKIKRELKLGGGRAMIREASCMCALDLVRRLVQNS